MDSEYENLGLLDSNFFFTLNNYILQSTMSKLLNFFAHCDASLIQDLTIGCIKRNLLRVAHCSRNGTFGGVL